MKYNCTKAIFYILLVIIVSGCSVKKSTAPLQADVGMIQWLIYALFKYIGYTAYCGFGLYFLNASGGYSNSKSVELGIYRLLLGAFFGLLVLITYGSTLTSPSSTDIYFLYGPIRVIEWGIIVWLMQTKFHEIKTPLWVFLGVIVSYAIDFLAVPGKMIGLRLC